MTQIQIIQSLSEALSWLEKEINWQANPKELTHLLGRIGELYVAIITNGNMPEKTNQPGYDVIMKEPPYDKISVKTTTRIGKGHIFFNNNTLDQVDRIIIIQVDIEQLEISVLYNALVADAESLMSPPNTDGKRRITLNQFTKPKESFKNLRIIQSAIFENYQINQLETGRIEVLKNNHYVGDGKNKEHLRRIAQQIGVDINTSTGNQLVTQMLGKKIISQLHTNN